MTGRIIQMPGDHHRQIQSLLPWYGIGGLDEADAALVEAHLGQCADCQAELRDEQRLSARIADLPIEAAVPDVEPGWAAISRQIAQEQPRRSPLRAWLARLTTAQPSRREEPWLRWALAGQACLVLILCGALWSVAQPSRYHALGAAPATAAANLIVIFRPETPEKDLRRILQANDARLVDGPTVADAYLLHVPEAGRTAALARLRRQVQVVLAEPVDSTASR